MKTVVVPEWLHKQLKSIAKKEGKVVQALVEQLLSDALKSRKVA
jgi:predicted HicB family RNase H-like nuclease